MHKIDMGNIADIAKLAADDVAIALAEDIGAGDLSTALLSSPQKIMQGKLISRERAVLCGCLWFEKCFSQLDSAAKVEWKIKEGAEITADEIVCTVQAKANALLSGERMAINFLQTLSATATAAREMQKAAGDIKIVDTRKTIPKLRFAQKYAVRIGGAHNHRLGLFDEILIKENHIAAAGGIAAALKGAKKTVKESHIQIEARTIEEVQEALAAGAKRILLDNFLPQQIQAAIKLSGNIKDSDDIEWEVSGNITPQTLSDYLTTGVHRISCGTLTKNINAIDFSFMIGEVE